MAAPQKNPAAPKTGLAAAAAKRAAIAAAAPEKEVEDALDGFSDEAEEAKEELKAEAEPEVEQEPEFKTRKQAAAEAKIGRKKPAEAASNVKPTDDFIRDKNGKIKKDEEGDEMRYAAGFHKGVGFVNDAGVRFPVGYRFKGGFIGSFGNVILNRCPKCFHYQSIDAARSGKCDNGRAGPDKQPCGFDMVRELEDFEIS